MRRLLRNAVTAFLIVATALLLVFTVFAPPRLVYLTISDPQGNGVEGAHIRTDRVLGVDRPLTLFGRSVFVVMGRASVWVYGDGYEVAEMEIGSSVEVLRGRVEHAGLASILHALHVELSPRDPKLVMTLYEGSLTSGEADRPREVLPIHPDFRGFHHPLDWLRRQYFIKTGKDASTLRYVSLALERDPDGAIRSAVLDFSHADGGAVEYIPPVGWPSGDLYRRVLYSMDRDAPRSEYLTRLSVLRDTQAATPYAMGSIFFHCVIDGHYGAGAVTAFFGSRRARQEASVKIWLNQQPGDPRVRHPR